MMGDGDRGVVMVPTAADAPPAQANVAVVVLDTAWTPGPGDREDLLPVRRIIAPVLARVDLFGDALRRLDAWAEVADLPKRLALNDVSVWYAMREELWHWLHERLIWRAVASALLERFGPVHFVVCSEDPALLDVMRLLDGAGVEFERPVSTGATIDQSKPGRPGTIPWSERVARMIGSPDRRLRRRRMSRRNRLLDERVRTMATGRPDRVLVISYTGVHQRVSGTSAGRSVDPNLGSVIERLRREGPDPIVIGLGLDHRVDDTWPRIAADDRLLPQSLLATRWQGSDKPDPSIIDTMTAALDALDAPLDLDGIDVGPDLTARVRAFADQWLTPTLTLAARVENLIAELRPSALLLTHEGIRAAWVVAAHRAGIPSFAVQHGMLYPTHPGYCHPRDATLILPDRTFVYGPYERDVLVEHGGYRPGEVEVSGSPRVDLDANGPTGRELEAERFAVRRELGVGADERMLVVSTAHAPLLRRFHLMDMIEKTLGGPLPGIHVVFKQHPAEPDEGPYRALLTGLARAGGYEPPRMTVVREVDLYRLLRASDAHLGFHSTVLTDAVVVGVPNLVAVVQSFSDPLDYLGSGVARPIRDVEDVRAAMREPTPPDPQARQAFLDRHFLPGDAGARIADRIRRTLHGDDGPSAGSAAEPSTASAAR
jgi:hypothetical protein